MITPQLTTQEHQVLLKFVSPEKIETITRYIILLLDFNEKKNLISKNTIPIIWTRHIIDCLQILPFLQKDANAIVDLGSGSGLPGVLIAIALPEKRLILVEKSPVKASFLSLVKDKLGLQNITIINKAIDKNILYNELQSHLEKMHNITFITRAFADLEKLLDIISLVRQKTQTSLVALKGNLVNNELENLSKTHRDQITLHNSITENGVVLVFTNQNTL
ncbi:MAG: Ribosomal small subunit methyltransferase [Pseudomonadota bacterium]|jgi:16S rRNA (guanine527-N7)-methyltransferase